MLTLKSFTFNPFSENTYIVYDPDTKEGIVVDPGMIEPDEKQRFDTFVSVRKIHLTMIVNTHMHIDHCIGNNYIKEKYAIKSACFATEIAFGEILDTQARYFGLNYTGYNTTVDDVLSDGQLIHIGDNILEVIALPGHSPGGLALYDRKDGWLISGDSLFSGSIGRTDLPGGNNAALCQGIRTRLFTLPESTIVYPGHGPNTTISTEKRSNPYVR